MGHVTAQMFLQTSGDVAVLGKCRLIESFALPVENKSLAELLDFERPGKSVLRSVPNASQLPAKAQGCRHAFLSKRASVCRNRQSLRCRPDISVQLSSA